jgi:hypothetical protein
MRSPFLLMLLLAGCPAPEDEALEVGYRDALDEGGENGERGNLKISEVLWSGSVKQVDGESVYDPEDIFIEIRNEGARPLNISNWYIELDGAIQKIWRIPAGPHRIEVGGHLFIAKKTTGCFPEPDIVLPTLELPINDSFDLTLRDVDERLINGAGHRTMSPFAGGYDLVVSRSMEMANIMFGARGNMPHVWHHYTDAEVDVPNNDRMLPECRRFTGASPGRPNSPDYAGSFAAGALE